MNQQRKSQLRKDVVGTMVKKKKKKKGADHFGRNREKLGIRISNYGHRPNVQLWSSPLSDFINKFLLEHSYSYMNFLWMFSLFFGCFLVIMVEVSSCD